MVDTKRCPKCGEVKSLAEFGKNACAKDGLQNRCKPCHVLAVKESREKRPWVRDANRAKHMARELEKNRAYKAANKEKHLADATAWRLANPEKRRIHHQNRRARIRAAGGELSVGLAKRLHNLQRGKCACCGLQLGDDYQLDHIMPLALGGTNTDDNIQLLRRQCNSFKRAKHPIEFMQYRGFLL